MDLVGLDGRSSSSPVAAAGGLGNKALSSPRRKAPGFALLGEPGDGLDIVLELKSLADVALIGFPSAGKSSLVSVLSAARPKIADYPFTTLVPNLGVVQAGEGRFTIADVPGLIPGASEGKGLGLEFLRHVERCSVLVHVIDCATLEPGRDPMTDLDVIEAGARRLRAGRDLGGRPLAERTRIVVLNKSDVPEARELAEMVKPDLEARGIEVFVVSAVAHTGLRELTFAMARRVVEARAEIEADAAATPQRIVIRPKAVDDSGFKVRPRGHPRRRGIPDRRRAPDPLGPPDRLLQRRGRRLPRRPARPGRRRGGAVQGRRGGGRHGAHRARRRRGRLRLGAHPRRRGRAARASGAPTCASTRPPAPPATTSGSPRATATSPGRPPRPTSRPSVGRATGRRPATTPTRTERRAQAPVASAPVTSGATGLSWRTSGRCRATARGPSMTSPFRRAALSGSCPSQTR